MVVMCGVFTGVYGILFLGLIHWMGVLGICIGLGFAYAVLIYHGMMAGANGRSREQERGMASLVAIVIFFTCLFLTNRWYWRSSPLAEARQQCIEFKQAYRDGDSTKISKVLNEWQDNPPEWMEE